MKKPLLLSLMALALASCRAYIPGVVSSSSEESFTYVSSSSSSISSSSPSISSSSPSSSSSDPTGGEMTPSGIISTDYRIEPVIYSGALVAGVSSVEVPTSISKSGTTYTVTATKTLTYYSTDYVLEHPSVASKATITDPALVAAYYIAFKAAPANYRTKTEWQNAPSDAEVFGSSNIRCISTYNRTDGYAQSVPWRANPYSYPDKPLYHELDVRLPGQRYSINSRGAGRVVAWEYGFTCYGSYATATYTDDHYATFHEYLNNGSFGTAFVGEES